MAKFRVFKCKKCGSMVIKINQGGCDPSCCGEPMKELRANDTDGAKEKHVPAVTIVDGVVRVEVGSVAHPMTEAHLINLIILDTTAGVQIAELHADDIPQAKFALLPGAEVKKAYAYCNLHGLWSD